MLISDFKQINTNDLSSYNLNTLEYYLQEGEKLICNMIELDPQIIEIVSFLSEEIRNRGK